MDLDAYVRAHSTEWTRLAHLVRRARRPRRLAGQELDELVALYERTATHLSVVRSGSPDPMLVDRLSTLVTRARAVVTGARPAGWWGPIRFVAVTFPAAVWRFRWWVAAAAGVFVVTAVGIGAWVATNPDVAASAGTPDEVRQLVAHDFENYYSSAPAASFGARVFVNNAQVAALVIALGPLLVLPSVAVLLYNATHIGQIGGLMVANDRGGLFFGLILPHGLLELTAVFIAAGTGIRLGWTLVDPGPQRRADAFAAEGRRAAAVVLGLVGAFAVAGFLESVITPSGLPTAARVGIGAAVEVGFLGYLFVAGRRAARAGETGDLVEDRRGGVALT